MQFIFSVAEAAILKRNETYRARSTEISMSATLASTLIYISFKLNFRTTGFEIAQQPFLLSDTII